MPGWVKIHTELGGRRLHVRPECAERKHLGFSCVEIVDRDVDVGVLRSGTGRPRWGRVVVDSLKGKDRDPHRIVELHPFKGLGGDDSDDEVGIEPAQYDGVGAVENGGDQTGGRHSPTVANAPDQTDAASVRADGWSEKLVRCGRGCGGRVPCMSHGIWNARVAARYDTASSEMFDDGVLLPTVEFLGELAGDGRALEFAVGTGRVAVPLSASGTEVCGIELSRPMVDQMMAKPGAERIPVTIGDMTTTRVAGRFGLVYLVYNTITNLLTQDEQVECFRNAAAHLEIGGHFVVEVFVPELRRLPAGETFVAFDVTSSHLGFDEYDVVNQRLVSHHYWIAGGRVETFESPHRYAWPAEYDLMARLAGMFLHERWSNWHRHPFTSTSTSHISVWKKSE